VVAQQNGVRKQWVRFEKKVELGDLVGEEIGEGLGKRRG
jgi:hypothetical protein